MAYNIGRTRGWRDVLQQGGYLEERLLHAPAAPDGQSFAGVEDACEEGAGVVDVVRAHRPSHLLLSRPETTRTYAQ